MLKMTDIASIDGAFYNPVSLAMIVNPVLVTGKFLESHVTAEDASQKNRAEEENKKIDDRNSAAKTETRSYSKKFLAKAFANGKVVANTQNPADIAALAAFETAKRDLKARQEELEKFIPALPFDATDDLKEKRKQEIETAVQNDVNCKRFKDVMATTLRERLHIVFPDPLNRKEVSSLMPTTDGRILMGIACAAAFDAIISNPEVINDNSGDNKEIRNRFLEYYGIDNNDYNVLLDQKRTAEHNKIIDTARPGQVEDEDTQQMVDATHNLRVDLGHLHRFIQNPKDPVLGLNDTAIEYLKSLGITQNSLKKNLKDHKAAADRPVFPGAVNLANNNSAVSLAQMDPLAAPNAGNLAALAAAELAKQLAIRAQQDRKNIHDAAAEKELEDALAASLKNDAGGAEPEDAEFAAALALSVADEKQRKEQEIANQQKILNEIAANNARRQAEQRAKREADDLARRRAEKEAEERRVAEERARKAAENRAAEENARRRQEENQNALAAAAHRAIQEQMARDNARLEQARREAREAAEKAKAEREAREAIEKVRAAQAAAQAAAQQRAAEEKAKAEREAKARKDREDAEKAKAAQLAAQRAAEEKARADKALADRLAAQQAANRVPANQQPAANPQPAAQVVNRAPQQPAANPNAAAVNPPAAAPNQPPAQQPIKPTTTGRRKIL